MNLIINKALRIAFLSTLLGLIYSVSLSVISYSQTDDHDNLTRLQQQFESHLADVDKRLSYLVSVQKLVAENTIKLAVLQEQTAGLVKRMDTMVYALWALSLAIGGQLLQWALATWRRSK